MEKESIKNLEILTSNAESESIFICKYCSKSTLEVDYEYLSRVDHLACVLELESKNK